MGLSPINGGSDRITFELMGMGESDYTPLEEFDAETISETLIRLPWPWTGDRPKISASCPETLQIAMEQLIVLMTELRSPKGGWPENLPFTPENLLPYVTEEVYEVLDLLTKIQEDNRASLSPQDSNGLVEDLSVQLLWTIATSSYGLMQMSGGVYAQKWEANSSQERGLLRVVPILEVQAESVQWAIDLATFAPPPLSPQATTEFQILSPSVTDPISGSDLIQYWRKELQTQTPHLQPWLEPCFVDILEPGKDWVSGTAQVTLGLEWMAEGMESDPKDSDRSILIQWTDPLLIDAYRQTLLSRALFPALDQLQTLDLLDVESPLKEIAITNQVLAHLNLLGKPILPSPFRFQLKESLQLHPQVSLTEWISYLLWELTSLSYDFMQCLGQVPAYVLQPEWGWDAGTLRLVALLNVKSIDQDLQLDLATGEPYTPGHFCLMNDAIIELSFRANEPKLTLQTDRFLEQMKTEIETARPALSLLFSGTGVKISASGQPWKLGLVQLTLVTEFIPA
ncbi:MAG: hypothetical protein J7545_15735 [Roseofilum sp. SBFL]|uniref:hypothetical protein n=1 Tax=unclassified Roseofilum TaxID=2620099 RepID=UPI001B250B2A|nr:MULTISPECIES: hypothetical protein [unclassified Roseofilum]MBP0013311.1 hypothetical protein [Roseofilum sp. SID3]MBP0039924.1 hypothetical protein [Roseofilum sp. SID1]MBP0043399.1 hypothetical protein [Roseofilum sp. SBFL]